MILHSSTRKKPTSCAGSGAGFSLLELVVAVAMFLIISAVSFTLFSRHEALLAKEQTLTRLNLGLRSTIAQIQTDLVNGGAGMIMGSGLPNAPIGVAIFNNTGTSCQNTTTFTYAATCFDQLWAILPDQTFQLMHGSAAFNTRTGSTINVTPVAANSPTNITMPSGTQIIFLQNTTSYPALFTTALLSSATTFNGTTAVALHWTSTGANGINVASNDPTGMTVLSTASTVMTESFAATDWIIALAPIQYYVDASNTADPQLKRKKANAAADLVLDQVIGFKVGATCSVCNNCSGVSTGTDTALYHYTTSDYCSDFSQVRSVRATVLTRTPPNYSLSFANPFDGGPYEVIGSSVVVNPRNMSAIDQ